MYITVTTVVIEVPLQLKHPININLLSHLHSQIVGIVLFLFISPIQQIYLTDDKQFIGLSKFLAYLPKNQ